MASGFDERLVKVIVDLGNNVKRVFQNPLDIRITGTNYANALQNEAQVVISNLDKDTQDYILTAVSPFNKNYEPKSVRIEAGRKSYGTSFVYEGNIVEATENKTSDIGITLKCLTGAYLKGNIVQKTMGGTISLKVIAQQIANDNKVLLSYQAPDKNIENYSYSSDSYGELQAINNFGAVNAFINNGILYVKDGLVPLTGIITIVNKDTGMIGIPEITEQGVRVKFLFDPKTLLGGALRLTSVVYPSLNGDYWIYKMGFEITTRAQPFYYIADCKRNGYQ